MMLTVVNGVDRTSEPFVLSGSAAVVDWELAVVRDIRASEQFRVLSNSPLFDKDFYRLAVEKTGAVLNGLSEVEHYILFGDDNRIAPHGIFDPLFYHEVNPDIVHSGMTSLFHFLSYGALERRDPHPAFSTAYVSKQTGGFELNPVLTYLSKPKGTFRPSPHFDETFVVRHYDTVAKAAGCALAAFFAEDPDCVNPSAAFDCLSYRMLHPDIRDMHPFYHYVRHGIAEGRQVVAVKDSFRGLLPQVNHVAAYEPDVVPPHTDILRLSATHSTTVVPEAVDLVRELLDPLLAHGAIRLFFVPELRRGGAEQVLTNIVRALLADSSERIAIISTEGSAFDIQSWLPRDRNLKLIDISHHTTRLGPRDAGRLIANVIQLSAVQHVYVINSLTAWTMLELYGKALSQAVTLHAFAFCYDYDRYGRRAGYAWTHLKAAIPYLTSVISDNASTPKAFARDLRLTADEAARFEVMYTPVPKGSASAAIRSGKTDRYVSDRKATILWASRFHQQKGLPVAIEVARLAMEYTVICAGGQADAEVLAGERIPGNVVFTGSFADFDELRRYNADVFLYTSLWDGLPVVLLQAGAAGIPIVARDAGGVAELVTPFTGQLVGPDADARTFLKAIRATLEDQCATKQRVTAMRRLIADRHSPEALARQISTSPSFQ